MIPITAAVLIAALTFCFGVGVGAMLALWAEAPRRRR